MAARHKPEWTSVGEPSRSHTREDTEQGREGMRTWQQHSLAQEVQLEHMRKDGRDKGAATQFHLSAVPNLHAPNQELLRQPWRPSTGEEGSGSRHHLVLGHTAATHHNHHHAAQARASHPRSPSLLSLPSRLAPGATSFHCPGRPSSPTGGSFSSAWRAGADPAWMPTLVSGSTGDGAHWGGARDQRTSGHANAAQTDGVAACEAQASGPKATAHTPGRGQFARPSVTPVVVTSCGAPARVVEATTAGDGMADARQTLL